MFKPNPSAMAKKGDLDGLLKALGHKDWMVAAEAVLHIQDFGAAAVPGLIKVLQKDRADVRGQAAILLGALGSAAESAVPALTAAQGDADESTRREAGKALKNIRDARRPNFQALHDILRELGFSKQEIADISLFCSLLHTDMAQAADDIMSREQSRAAAAGRKKVKLSPWAAGEVDRIRVMLQDAYANLTYIGMKKKIDALAKFYDIGLRESMVADMLLEKAVTEVIGRGLRKKKA